MEKSDEIKIEEADNNIDYESNQFVQISYKKENEKWKKLHGYNTSKDTHVIGIYLEHYGNLNDDNIEEVQIVIKGSYDSVTILGNKNESFKLSINSFSSDEEKTFINHLSITAGNFILFSSGKISFMDCIGMSRLTIHSTVINLLSLDRIENVEITECQISKLIYSHMKKLKESWGKVIDEIMISFSSFDHFMLYDEVNNLTFYECDTNRFTLHGEIDIFKEVSSNIVPASQIAVEKFGTINKDCCKLGLRAAKVSDDLELYIEYNDLLMDLEKKSKPRMKRLSYCFLNKTTGYGFKPIRALWFSMKAIAVFAFIYSIIDLLMGRISVIKITNWSVVEKTVMMVSKYLYQSGITYTTIGFSDVLNVNPIIGLLYVFEAMLGISVLALFIFAMTRKYFFGK